MSTSLVEPEKHCIVRNGSLIYEAGGWACLCWYCWGLPAGCTEAKVVLAVVVCSADSAQVLRVPGIAFPMEARVEHLVKVRLVNPAHRC
eukprot:scaffold149806_cov21-Tisochrysis_lutea.AAC.1